MGSLELDEQLHKMVIHSHLITYGNAAGPSITEYIREEIESMWNEPRGRIYIDNQVYQVVFRITGSYLPDISPVEIFENVDPRNNYFRIEAFAHGNISFVDGLGCNSGYFLLDNLYRGSTTAAHEYGHTLGLHHPTDLDIRGSGTPGIMYPRGTVVDAEYQYNPAARAGDNTDGGTMHPMHRRVKQEDIELLKLHKLDFDNGQAIVGDFTSVWHPDHGDISSNDYLSPLINQ